MRRLVVLLICACALPVSDASAWTWPVAGPVLRPFSFDHAHPYAAGQHRGIDVGASSGSPVLAPAQGVVSFAGTVPTGGKTVSIQTPFGYTATLVHLGSIEVGRGAHVDEGSVVGTVGPSGTAEPGEPYVYFGVRTTSDEQGYVDPLAVLPPRVVSSPAAEEPTPAAGCGRRRLGGRRLTDGTGNLRAGRGRSTAVGRSGHRERSCGLDGPECCFVAGRRCAGERPRRVDRAWVRDPGPRRACGHHTGFGGSLSRTTGAVRTRTRGCPRSPARSSSPAARSECRAARTDPLGTAFASPRIVRGDVEPGAAEFAVGSCVARTAGSRSR